MTSEYLRFQKTLLDFGNYFEKLSEDIETIKEELRLIKNRDPQT